MSGDTDAELGVRYSGGVEFLDYKLWKALAIVAFFFVAGLMGWIPIDRPKGERPDKRPE